MIAVRLVHALATSALLALCAACLAPVLRASRRPTRHLWTGTLVLAACWPLLQRAAIALLPRDAEPTPSLGARLLAPVVVGTAEEVSRVSSDDVVLVLWLVASSLLLLRLATAMVRLARERTTWRPDHIDGVPVRIAPDVGPAVVGFGRMEIVVPRWIKSLDPALRILALHHEEEHRRARDPLLLLAAAVVVMLLPWNLPLWWIARRLRLAIELDCDARVLGRYPDASRYGRLLLLVAQRSGARPLAPALSESVSNLQRRIDAMSTTFKLSMRHGAMLGAATSVCLAAACSLRAPTNATSGPVLEPAESAPPASRDQVVIESSEGPKVMPAHVTFFEFQVDTQVRIKQAVPPRYPAEQRSAGTDGVVLAQFVVDTTGTAEMESFKIVKSNHEAFSESVRTAVALTTFHPAELGGRKVRQLVQMPFQFSTSKAKASVPPETAVRPAAPAAPDAAAPAARQPFFEFTVDREAAIKLAVPPRYPDHLRAAKLEGEVVASFVVDTTGLAEMSTFKVKSATDPAFVESVKTSLAQMTFHPAEVKGRKVRQLITMPFQFSLSK